MTYEEIDSYLLRTGLAKEPAFEYLHFLIEPIPQRDKRVILGLFFPEGEINGQPFGYLPPSTIILPEDASEMTLLHELGHRYGHFYFNDISEPFAENWAKAHYKEASMNGVAALNPICVGCPELQEGRQICRFCELGASAFEVMARVAPRVATQVATITGYLRAIRVEYQGITQTIYPAPATRAKIPAGQTFQIWVDWHLENPGGGLWSGGVTMKEAANRVPRHSSLSDAYYSTIWDKNNVPISGADLVMPSQAITLTFQLWAAPYQGQPFPPSDQW